MDNQFNRDFQQSNGMPPQNDIPQPNNNAQPNGLYQSNNITQTNNMVQPTNVQSPNNMTQPNNMQFQNNMATQNVMPQPSDISQPMMQSNNNKNNSIIIIIILAVIVVGIVVFYFLNQNKNDDKSINDITTTTEERETTTDVNEKTTTTANKPTTTTTSKPDNTSLSSDWKSFKFSVNGKVYSLPISYQQFSSDTGFTLDPSAATTTVKNNYYVLTNLQDNGKKVFSTEILNNTGSETTVSNGIIFNLSQQKFYTESLGAPKAIFPGNLTTGISITKEQIVNLFGEPSNIRNYVSDDGDYKSDTYSYYLNKDFTTFDYYEIVVINGIIDTLKLDHGKY